MEPSPVPAVTIPTASERSLGGNHSAIALLAAGKFADSPIPSRNLTLSKLRKPWANACAMPAILHSITAKDSAL